MKLSDKHMKQLQLEVRDLIRDDMRNANITTLEHFVNDFEQIYQQELKIALKRMSREYFESPCCDCWNGCADVDRIYYCPNNT